MFDIIAVGEILIDLVGTGDLQFSGTVGGAPCNALAQAAKLGSRTAFIGMVGDDAFGRACAHQLDELKIDRTYLAVTQQADTTLAFVTLDKNGDRDFTFYRRPGADTLLTVKNIPFGRIAQSRVYLFGGVSLSQDPTRAAVFYSLFKLSGTSVLRAFDPNLRPVLWEDLDEAKALGRKAMGLCDILKLSSEEAVFFSGRQNPLDGARALQEEFRIPLVLMMHGFQRMFCFAARRLLPPRCNTNPVGGHHCRRRLLLRRIPAPVIAAFVYLSGRAFSRTDRRSRSICHCRRVDYRLPPRIDSCFARIGGNPGGF